MTTTTAVKGTISIPDKTTGEQLNLKKFAEYVGPMHSSEVGNPIDVGEIRTTNIRGKQYVEVAERIRIFHVLCPNGRIVTELLYGEGGHYIIKAIATPDIRNSERFFTGHAHEDEAKSQINKTSAIENCETSATGRALGLLGLGSEISIASAEEVRNAIHQQGAK